MKSKLLSVSPLLELPRFPVEPLAFYRIEFEARGSEAGYWVVDFYYRDGRAAYADNYSEVYAATDWQRQVAVVMSRNNSVSARLAFRQISAPFEIRNPIVVPITRSEACCWVEEMGCSLPPLTMPPPPDRWDRLLRTREILQAGGRLRMVVLGDSVANDMLNGHPQLMIERYWPGTEFVAIHAMEPEKGCSGYQHNGCVDRYVVDHRPDLLVIAGMSFGGDLEAVLNVIGQAREKLPDVDILVAAVSVIDAGGNGSAELRPFLDRLRLAGAERHFAVADLRRPWEDFIAQSPQPAAWYKRDSHHANDRGKNVLARMFATLFLP